MSTQDPKSDTTLAALRTAVMALAYAAEKLPEVQKAYNDVSAAIEASVQQAAEAVGPDGVRAALRTDWSEPKAAEAYQDWMRTGKAAKDPVQEHYNAFCAGWRMRAQRAAAPRAQEPVGWKLVPAEPTIGMCLAGDEARLNADDATLAAPTYRAMLAAAPQPAAAQNDSELAALLRELIDTEGPQPGTAEWADRVHAALARHATPARLIGYIDPAAVEWIAATGPNAYMTSHIAKLPNLMQTMPIFTGQDEAAAARQPRTDEQIDAETAAERDALLDHIYEYGTASEGVQRLVRKLCRRAHGIGTTEGGAA